MRSLSAGVVLPPSGVVQNERRPGASEFPGAPSTLPFIRAWALKEPLPSPALNSIVPITSPFCTAVFAPVEVPLDLPRDMYAGLASLLFLVRAKAEVPESVPSCWKLAFLPPLKTLSTDVPKSNLPDAVMRSLSVVAVVPPLVLNVK